MKSASISPNAIPNDLDVIPNLRRTNSPKFLNTTINTNVSSLSLDASPLSPFFDSGHDASIISNSGVTLTFIRKLKTIVNDRNAQWTTSQVCDALIKPWTRLEKCSMIDSFLNNYTKDCHPELGLTSGQATVFASLFIVHAWDSNFIEFVESLESFIESNENLRNNQSLGIWIDVFSTSLWHPIIHSLPNWINNYISLMKSIPTTVCIMKPWENPLALKDTRCLHHIYCNIRAGNILHFQVATTDKKIILQKLLVEEFEKYFNIYYNMDFSSSLCNHSGDRDVIMEALSQKPHNFYEVNKTLKKGLIQSFFFHVKDLITDEKNKTKSRANSFVGTTVDDDDGSHSDMFLNNHTLKLQYSLAYLYFKNDDLQLAEDTCKENLQLHLQYIQMNHESGKDTKPATLAMLKMKSLLANIYKASKQLSLAQSTYVETVTTYQSELGVNHTDVLQSQKELASCYLLSDSLLEAEKILQELIQKETQLFGEKDSRTLQSTCLLASVLSQRGQYVEAEIKYQRVFELQTTLAIVDDNHCFATGLSLAQVLSDQSKFSEAESLLRKLYDTCKNRFGETAPDTILIVNKLAMILTNSHQLESSQLLYQDVLQQLTTTYGATASITLSEYNNFAALLAYQNQFGEAEAIYHQTLNGYKETVGLCDSQAIETMGYLSDILKRQEKLEEATAIMKEEILYRGQLNGSNDLLTLQKTFELCALYERFERFQEAEVGYRQILLCYEEKYGIGHRDTANVAYRLGVLLRDVKKFKEAAEMFRKAYTGLNAVLGGEDEETVDALQMSQICFAKSAMKDLKPTNHGGGGSGNNSSNHNTVRGGGGGGGDRTTRKQSNAHDRGSMRASASTSNNNNSNNKNNHTTRIGSNSASASAHSIPPSSSNTANTEKKVSAFAAVTGSLLFLSSSKAKPNKNK